MIARAPDLRVIDLQPVGTNNTWRLRWNSTPGADYQLQRSKDDRLAAGGDSDWLPLLTIRATNTVTAVDDPAGPLVAQRFYRVVQFTNAVADVQPPVISYVGVEAASTFNGSSALRVRFLAGDNVGVSSVVIREGATTLGLATPTGGSNWVFVVPAAVGSFQSRFFTGIASDPSGNTAQATGGVLVSDPDRFVPLDPDGTPREGRFLTALTTNQAGPFVYRPGGRPRPGAAPDLFLNFPDGATFLQITNRTVMQFVRINAGFDTNSPFRFTTAPQRNSGPGRQLVLGPLAFNDLSALFDLSVTNDFALTLFNRFPIRWRGGSIDDRGLPGAQFLPQLPNFPLPGWSQALPGLLIDFARERTLRLPLVGTFALPDGRIHRKPPHRQNHLGLQQFNLAAQKGLALGDFSRLGVAVAGWPALDHVENVGVGLPARAHGLEHVVQQLPGLAHKGLARAVFVFTGAFTHNQPVDLRYRARLRGGGAHPKHGVFAAFAELASPAGGNRLLQGGPVHRSHVLPRYLQGFWG